MYLSAVLSDDDSDPNDAHENFHEVQGSLIDEKVGDTNYRASKVTGHHLRKKITVVTLSRLIDYRRSPVAT